MLSIWLLESRHYTVLRYEIVLFFGLVGGGSFIVRPAMIAILRDRCNLKVTGDFFIILKGDEFDADRCLTGDGARYNQSKPRLNHG